MAYFKLSDGEVRKLMLDGIKKAGSERKLGKKLGVSKGTIYSLKNEERHISEIYLKRLLEFLEKENYVALIERKYDNNWGRKKGGNNSVNKKIQDGTLSKTLKKMRKASSLKMKQWHKTMREKHPEEYEKWKFERFGKTREL